MRLLVIILVTLLHLNLYSQIIDKVLISGIAGYEDHDSDVKKAFLEGYSSYDGSQFSGIIEIYSHNIEESFNYAEQNNFQLIIRSTTGLTTGIYYANQFPDIKLIMPSGSNSSILTYDGEIETCPVIVTGAGNNNNLTGYKIDFFSIDPITSSNLSSFSNGYIAGQLTYIANTANSSIESAREKSRQTASLGGTWDEVDGYGTINVENSIVELLPVELINFYGKILDNSILLTWTTATEVNNYGFEIQTSTDSSNTSLGRWETIGFVDGHGNSNSPKEYSYIVSSNSAVNQYYRLKQIDFDGSYKYSKIIKVNINLNKIELFQNYPNPFNPTTQISFTLPDAEHVIISVFNMIGEKVSELANKEMEAGIHKIEFNGEKLTSGFYLYRLETPDYTQTKKMLLIK